MTPSAVDRLAHAFNSADPGALRQVYAPSARLVHVFFPAPLEGIDSILAAETPMFAAFSDIEWTSTETVEGPGRIAVEYTVKATNTGSMPTPEGALPPTGRRIEIRGFSLLKVDEYGMVTEERRYFDTASMFRQLGLA